MSVTSQITEVARIVRIKADACNRLATQTTDLAQRNWQGLADELTDVVYMLEQIAAGKQVAGLKGERDKA